MVKVTGLTRLNVEALREAFPRAEGFTLKLTSTTATFTDLTAEQALYELGKAMGKMRAGHHPRQSLYAVRRKLERQL